ncbi:hypothetical protein M5K25_013921 [Dendrobium thyrsiflorum]|uniref:Uncharacterized protein n=1 Tax=Dendrobium thyrsiflorum TaxID=117978 RepID=A0ABD0UU93_DENTH
MVAQPKMETINGKGKGFTAAGGGRWPAAGDAAGGRLSVAQPKMETINGKGKGFTAAGGGRWPAAGDAAGGRLSVYGNECVKFSLLDLAVKAISTTGLNLKQMTIPVIFCVDGNLGYLMSLLLTILLFKKLWILLLLEGNKAAKCALGAGKSSQPDDFSIKFFQEISSKSPPLPPLPVPPQTTGPTPPLHKPPASLLPPIPINRRLLQGTPQRILPCSCMADPEVDNGFMYDSQGRVDILLSPFFDPNGEIEDTVDDYVDRILFQLTETIDEQRPAGQWRIVGRPLASSPPINFPLIKTIDVLTRH